MKTVLAIMVSLSLCVGASAQKRGGYGGYYHVYSPRVVVAPSFGYGFGYGFGYPYYGYPYFGSPYYGYPGAYGYRGTSSKLALQIQSITLDYRTQIRNTRHNKSLSRAERRTQIRNLKNEREQAIITAQQNFRNGRTNYQNRGQNNNGNGNLNNGNGGTNNQNNPNGTNNSNTSAVTNS